MSDSSVSVIRMLLWGGLLGLFGATLQGAEPSKTHRVLFIGVDGCRPDALETANTPNIDRLIAAGTFATGTDILPERPTKNDTVSGPGWSQLLTGVWSDKHGVLDNSFKGKNYSRYPHFFARIKEVRTKAITASFSTWPPIKDQITSAADVSENYLPDNHDYAEADKQATAACVKYLESHDPDALVLYLGNVDETGHKHGFHPKVAKYVAAIEQVDAHVGEVLEALAKRPQAAKEEWLILIATDHGGSGTGHGGGRENPDIRRTFLIVSGPGAKVQKIDDPTSQVDVVATALAYLGIAAKPEWELDGHVVGLKQPR